MNEEVKRQTTVPISAIESKQNECRVSPTWTRTVVLQPPSRSLQPPNETRGAAQLIRKFQEHRSREKKVPEGLFTESSQAWQVNTERIRGPITTEPTRQLPGYEPYVQPLQKQYRGAYTQPPLSQLAWESHRRNITAASQFSNSSPATAPIQYRRGTGFRTPPDGRQSWSWGNNQLRHGNQIPELAFMATGRIPAPPNQ